MDNILNAFVALVLGTKPKANVIVQKYYRDLWVILELLNEFIATVIVNAGYLFAKLIVAQVGLLLLAPSLDCTAAVLQSGLFGSQPLRGCGSRRRRRRSCGSWR